MVGGLALAGCGAGQVAQTAEQQPDDRRQQRAGRPAGDPRRGPRVPERRAATPKGSNARLRMVVVNEGATDTLVDGADGRGERGHADRRRSRPRRTPRRRTPSATTASPSTVPVGDRVRGRRRPVRRRRRIRHGVPPRRAAPRPDRSATPTEAAERPDRHPARRVRPLRGGGAGVQLAGLTRTAVAGADAAGDARLPEGRRGHDRRSRSRTPEREVSPAPTVTTVEGDQRSEGEPASRVLSGARSYGRARGEGAGTGRRTGARSAGTPRPAGSAAARSARPGGRSARSAPARSGCAR